MLKTIQWKPDPSPASTRATPVSVVPATAVPSSPSSLSARTASFEEWMASSTCSGDEGRPGARWRRKVSTTVRLAASPRACPPMPSATR